VTARNAKAPSLVVSDEEYLNKLRETKLGGFMRRHLPLRLLVCAAALAGSASVAAVAIPGGIAGAAALSVKCTGLTGNASTQSLSGCSGKGFSETGATGTSDVSTSTITWATGNTSVAAVTYKEYTGKKDKCPAPMAGYTAVAEVKEKGSVTGGNALVGSKIKGTVCVYSQTSSGDILVNGDGAQTV
jgi:hypothetical protein